MDDSKLEDEERMSKKQKMLKPPKKQKRNKDGLDALINEYKSSFTKGEIEAEIDINRQGSSGNIAIDRSSVVKRRWFE